MIVSGPGRVDAVNTEVTLVGEIAIVVEDVAGDIRETVGGGIVFEIGDEFRTVDI